MTYSLKEELETQVIGWEFIGHPAISQRFVLRNGKAFAPRARPGNVKKGKVGYCFANALTLALDNPQYSYVEGYAVDVTIGLPLVHAWCIDSQGFVIDNTWVDSKKSQYIGVVMDTQEVKDEVDRQGFYGVLGVDLTNVDYIFRHDPELKGVVDKVIKRRSPISKIMEGEQDAHP